MHWRRPQEGDVLLTLQMRKLNLQLKYINHKKRIGAAVKRSKNKVIVNLITWTWAFIISVSASINPSSTFEISINFFHPQSCSFFQNRCNVSAKVSKFLKYSHGYIWKSHYNSKWQTNQPEYFDFLGSLFTTAMVNCAKWLQPIEKTTGAVWIQSTTQETCDQKKTLTD